MNIKSKFYIQITTIGSILFKVLFVTLLIHINYIVIPALILASLFSDFIILFILRSKHKSNINTMSQDYITPEEHEEIMNIVEDIIFRKEKMNVADSIIYLEKMDISLKHKLAVMFILGKTFNDINSIVDSTTISTLN